MKFDCVRVEDGRLLARVPSTSRVSGLAAALLTCLKTPSRTRLH